MPRLYTIYPPLTENEINSCVGLYKANHSLRAISVAINKPEHKIYSALKKCEIEFRPRAFQKGNIWNSGENHNKWKGGVSNDKKYQREKDRQRIKDRLASDPLFKIKVALRHRIQRFFLAQKRLESGFIKAKKSSALLGADTRVIFSYLESQFRDGMTWENHGAVWHIDHKIPLCTARNKERLEELFHYTNLQPLLIKENLVKGRKLWEGK